MNQAETGGIRGEGFVMKPNPNLTNREDNGSDESLRERERMVRVAQIATQNINEVDDAADMLEFMLEGRDNYSEMYTIRADGIFDAIRPDGAPRFMTEFISPEILYRLSKKIQDTRPDLKFSFEQDPEARWFKYTVTVLNTKNN